MENVSITVPMSPAGLSMLKAASGQLAAILGASGTAPTMPAASAAAASSVGASASASSAAAQPAKGKPGRKPKAVANEIQGATADAGDDFDLGGQDESEMVDELGLDEPAAPAAPAKKLTLNEDVIPAFRDALARVGGDKSKLAAVLSDYGVKSVQALPEAKYVEVVTKLARLK